MKYTEVHIAAWGKNVNGLLNGLYVIREVI